MDTTPLLSEPDDGSMQGSPYHLPQPLRGPSLDELAGCGVEVRNPGDDITATGIDFRNVTSLSTNVLLDRLKEHEGEQDPTMRKVVCSSNLTNDDAVAVDMTRRSPIHSTPTYSDQTRSDHSALSAHPRHNGNHTYTSVADSRSGSVPPLTKGSRDVTTRPRCGEMIHSYESAHPVAITVEAISPPCTNVAPPLSEGKKYHVFFSYEITDREWVEEVTKQLESPELGFKCSMHERDFHGGKRIIENITEHIRLSEKTVLVLSPDFIQSHWCMFEIEMGMILSMEESQLLVVPVMVEQCRVPDSIKTLTYIDATPGHEWWQRFIDAIVSKDDLLGNLTGTKDLRIEPRHGNMDLLTELSSDYKCLFGEQMRVPYIPETLLRPGIEVPTDEFQRAMDIIRSASCFCRLFCDLGPCCVPVFACLLVLGIMFIVLFFATGYQTPTLCWSLSLPWSSIAITFYIQRRMRWCLLRKAVAEVNTIFLKYNVIVGFKLQAGGCILSRTFLQFWFYDPTECKKFLETILEDRDLEMGLTTSKASLLIQHHCGDYTSAYNEGRLKGKHGARHVRTAICLCQFLEDMYSESK
ncbi:uncharacterized protein LOC124137220 [Haliotis rufescens]|uniref:uncharacterized protein LOC124137220 n=1 Tax=Haliotis rufescens TaxID=6454 RepID=UPI00201F1A72|nr:uncharacterized protein LOC124137220 [Haliotis rufescens]XP_046359379.2 uncharacterized protein LOC124137220 [Haliotis rufescens]XP_046359380.2 uncharacterized protein LOC124137220 [Haliotis rufescens]